MGSPHVPHSLCKKKCGLPSCMLFGIGIEGDPMCFISFIPMWIWCCSQIPILSLCPSQEFGLVVVFVIWLGMN